MDTSLILSETNVEPKEPSATGPEKPDEKLFLTVESPKFHSQRLMTAEVTGGYGQRETAPPLTLARLDYSPRDAFVPPSENDALIGAVSIAVLRPVGTEIPKEEADSIMEKALFLRNQLLMIRQGRDNLVHFLSRFLSRGTATSRSVITPRSDISNEQARQKADELEMVFSSVPRGSNIDSLVAQRVHELIDLGVRGIEESHPIRTKWETRSAGGGEQPQHEIKEQITQWFNPEEDVLQRLMEERPALCAEMYAGRAVARTGINEAWERKRGTEPNNTLDAWETTAFGQSGQRQIHITSIVK